MKFTGLRQRKSSDQKGANYKLTPNTNIFLYIAIILGGGGGGTRTNDEKGRSNSAANWGFQLTRTT
jgi:hypothetical protein